MTASCPREKAFNCSKKELTRGWLDDLKSHQIPVNVYTLNDDIPMKRLITLGISGIFTNKPDLLKSVLEDFRWKRGVKGEG